ncbi:ribosomal l1 domain-containing protein 1 [Phtheirospermum japonicum]|uniref:Ribosomal l1 domain-containing protein 1 n=1 Tax=Phtheirospermum japonicum TaxID=374723 RepID=A0A830BTX1_9LAMI|nr:ribosomal l1 domain-containing protein 1 [Phtheirospermum japonicum]
MAESLAAPPTSRVQKPTIDNAVSALLKHKSAVQSSTDKLQLLPDDDYIYLNLTLKKIPSNPRTNPFKIPLPHPILDAASQLCLIIDDRPKSPTPPSDQIKKLIKAHNIPISKVIKISKLKTNYKPFEAKRKLCDSYDLFLVDKRVVHLLPKLLGKKFFQKKKLPLGVDLGKKNLKLQVERALGSALLYLRTGTCCVMKVGKVAMDKDEIAENVFDAINCAVERVPKKWDGVRSLLLKFSDSVALPIYVAMPDMKLKIEGLKEMEKGGDEIVKSSDNEEISGKKDGKIGKKKKKGRIHEVHYMDVVKSEVDGGESLMDEDLSINNGDVEKKVKKAKKGKKDKALKEEVLGVSDGEKKKGKKKNDVGKKSNEKAAKVKDVKHKKRVSAK